MKTRNKVYRRLSQTHKRQYCAAMSAVRDVFDLDPIQLQLKTRQYYIMWPRQLCMCMFTEAFNWTHANAAGVFSNMNHGSSIHGRKAVYARIETNKDDKEQARRLIDRTLKYCASIKAMETVQYPIAGVPSVLPDHVLY